MKISTKGRYALRFMVSLCTLGADREPVPLRRAALDMGVSTKYLEQIAATLTQAGLVRVVRGSSGGYILKRRPEEYTAYEILQPVEGSLAPVSCLDGGESGCERCDTCKTLPLWQGLGSVIADYLSGNTLLDIVNGELDK